MHSKQRTKEGVERGSVIQQELWKNCCKGRVREKPAFPESLDSAYLEKWPAVAEAR